MPSAGPPGSLPPPNAVLTALPASPGGSTTRLALRELPLRHDRPFDEHRYLLEKELRKLVNALCF